MKKLKMILASLVLATGYIAHADTQKEFVIPGKFSLEDAGIKIRAVNLVEGNGTKLNEALTEIDQLLGKTLTVTLKETISDAGYIEKQTLEINGKIPSENMTLHTIEPFGIRNGQPPYKLSIEYQVCTTDSCGDKIVKGKPVSNPTFNDNDEIYTVECPVDTDEACQISAQYDRQITH
jgi:hypothetical protein